jgi:hypothetical protein
VVSKVNLQAASVLGWKSWPTTSIISPALQKCHTGSQRACGCVTKVSYRESESMRFLLQKCHTGSQRACGCVTKVSLDFTLGVRGIEYPLPNATSGRKRRPEGAPLDHI